MNTSKNPSHVKKLITWHNVKELYSKGLNQCQISTYLGIYRGTVRHYLSMTGEEFLASDSYQRHYRHKLDHCENFIVNELQKYPFLSSSQIEDRLKEHHKNMKNVCSKTIFNFVKYLRKKHNLPKSPEGCIRPYEMQPETAFGEYCQVDFGERSMIYPGRGFIKVYFFVAVLSRSRKKFLFFSLYPFTTELTIYAHELAFQYYGGKPRKIIYDQEKVFLNKENLGDFVLTEKFRTFVNTFNIKYIFCHKNDPESKGKVENVVKYVKHNFLKGREFINIETLNNQAIEWLNRTGNGSLHHGIQRIPDDVFIEEQPYLAPYHGTPILPHVEMKEYHVRKDNTINYRCNFYTVPTGTYKGARTTVLVHEEQNSLHIFSKVTGKIIAEHFLCKEKGKLISIGNHNRNKESSLIELEERIKSYLGDSEAVNQYLALIQKDKQRYYRNNLNYIIYHMNNLSAKNLIEAMYKCTQEQLYNGKIWIGIANYLQKNQSNIPGSESSQTS